MAVEGEALLEGDTVAAVVAVVVVVVAGMVDARSRITEAFWFVTFLWIAGSVFFYHGCHFVCVSV
jgi:type IV secretory pathway VirB2 component (pilin)